MVEDQGLIAGRLLPLGARPLSISGPKHLLYEVESEADSLFYLERGVVRLFTPWRDSAEFVYQVLCTGDIFGEEAILEGGLRRSAAAVIGEGLLWVISASVVRQGRPEHSRTLSWMLERLAVRDLRLHHRMQAICLEDVYVRILQELLELAPQFSISRETRVPGGLEARIPITQATFAGLVCSTRETVSTRLNRLEELGLLMLSPGMIGIPSIGRLEAALTLSRNR